jgi:SAM-dependent methyltransferase
VSQNPFRPEHFQRLDEAPDAEFYGLPRLVVHIDPRAIAAVGQLYAELLPANGSVLDLMSSWRSHLPATFAVQELIGLGMNATEMEDNPRLTSFVLQDLNANPVLPFSDDRFEGAILTVSVQYLTRPVEVFAEVYRVLRPGARFIVTFSNRCFPTKAVAIWRALDDRGHLDLAAAYFRYSAAWIDLHAEDRTPREDPAGDPVFAVHAAKADFQVNDRAG